MTGSRTVSQTRRALLATLGTVGLAGCSTRSRGEGDEIEIMPNNEMDESREIAVRIEDDTGEAVFSHVYELGAGKLSESEGISPDVNPTRISVFVRDGPSKTWEYAPDQPTHQTCQQDGPDIGVTLTAEETLDPWYTC